MTSQGIPFHGQLTGLRANAPDRLLGRRLSIGTNARLPHATVFFKPELSTGEPCRAAAVLRPSPAPSSADPRPEREIDHAARRLQHSSLGRTYGRDLSPLRCGSQNRPPSSPKAAARDRISRSCETTNYHCDASTHHFTSPRHLGWGCEVDGI